jgi:hypothetical protein
LKKAKKRASKFGNAVGAESSSEELKKLYWNRKRKKKLFSGA